MSAVVIIWEPCMKELTCVVTPQGWEAAFRPLSIHGPCAGAPQGAGSGPSVNTRAQLLTGSCHYWAVDETWVHGKLVVYILVTCTKSASNEFSGMYTNVWRYGQRLVLASSSHQWFLGVVAQNNFISKVMIGDPNQRLPLRYDNTTPKAACTAT